LAVRGHAPLHGAVDAMAPGAPPAQKDLGDVHVCIKWDG
jgi:hypothetical protein